MREEKTNIKSEWKEREKRLSKRSAKEKFFDRVSDAFLDYVNEIEIEKEQLRMENKTLRAQIEYLKQYCAQYGVSAPDLSKGILMVLPIDSNNKWKREKNFIDLVQCNDKENLLSRLHARVDGHGGKNVALVMLRAKADKQISRLPSKKEFYSEFKDCTGAWRSISHFFSPSCTPAPDISSVII